jgi:hypothetical protein
MPPRSDEVQAVEPSTEVRSRIRAGTGETPTFYFEVWTDLGDECRFALKTGGPFATKEEAERAREEAVRLYPVRV